MNIPETAYAVFVVDAADACLRKHGEDAYAHLVDAEIAARALADRGTACVVIKLTAVSAFGARVFPLN